MSLKFKKTPIFFTLLTLCSVALPIPLNAREWHDTQGRKIEADILSKSETSVRVRMKNGRVFNIPLEKLSADDQAFIKSWEPTTLEVPDISSAVYLITTGKSSGTGFLAQDNGIVYLYTNQHVIQATEKKDLMAKNAEGDVLKLGTLEVIPDKDIARIMVQKDSGLTVAKGIVMGEKIATYGNSDGAGVMTHNEGKVLGLSDTSVEVSAEIVPGNSGGPIVNAKNEVIGIASYISRKNEKEEDEDWTTKGTRYGKTRRFGLKLTDEDRWTPISWQQYVSQGKEAKAVSDTMNAIFDMTFGIMRNPQQQYNKDSYENSLLRRIAEEQNEQARRYSAKLNRRVNSGELARMNRFENKKLEERMNDITRDINTEYTRLKKTHTHIKLPYFAEQINDWDSTLEYWERYLKANIYDSNRKFFVFK